MNKRPRIELHLTQTDMVLEILGWVAIVGIWTLTLINYFELPEIIPTHYNGAGKADGFGNKANILTLPIVSTILFVGMTILNKYPHVFNYQSEITADLIDSILDHGICNLPLLSESAELHRIFIREMHKHWRNSGNPPSTFVPIT